MRMPESLNRIPQDTSVHLMPFLDDQGHGILVALKAGRRLAELTFTDTESRERASSQLWAVLYKAAAEKGGQVAA